MDRRQRDDHGAATLELVVVFPIVLLIIFAVVQGALYYHGKNIALAAAQEGVRVARAENGSATEGSSTARRFFQQAGGSEVLLGMGVRSRRGATEASVTVTGTSLSVLPGVSGFRVSQTAEGPVERFTSSGGR